MTETQADTRTVTVERRLAHPPERVWHALTEPHLMAEWLMQTDFVAEQGRRFTLRGDWGAVDCQVLEIEPHRRLAYRWDAMGLESVVTFTLTPAADGTLLRMDQVGFRSDQQREHAGAQHGWQAMFGKLESVLDGIA